MKRNVLHCSINMHTICTYSFPYRHHALATVVLVELSERNNKQLQLQIHVYKLYYGGTTVIQLINMQ